MCVSWFNNQKSFNSKSHQHLCKNNYEKNFINALPVTQFVNNLNKWDLVGRRENPILFSFHSSQQKNNFFFHPSSFRSCSFLCSIIGSRRRETQDEQEKISLLWPSQSSSPTCFSFLSEFVGLEYIIKYMYIRVYTNFTILLLFLRA